MTQNDRSCRICSWHCDDELRRILDAHQRLLVHFSWQHAIVIVGWTSSFLLDPPPVETSQL